MSVIQEEHNVKEIALQKESIGSIFQDNVKPLKNYVSRFFTSSHDVEDVLQDVYIRIIEAEKNTSIKMPKAFIYKVARNLALNEKSRAGHKMTSSMDDEDPGEIATGISLEDRIEQEQRFEHFCNSVNKLPPQCKKVFILKKVHGFSNSEIAQQLNITVSTVDKHLAKGLIDCKNDLQRLGHLTPERKAKPVKSRTIIKTAINDVDYCNR